ncbi:MAG TPA: flavoprotein, partial [Bacteroidia bacterium]|nr:flavoprotein [Bacteroidia bacterium]
MNQKNKYKIVVAITGASGSVYAKVLLDKLKKASEQIETVSLVMSDNAKDVWKHELKSESFSSYGFNFYAKTDFNAPFASGSSKF